jgi:hypothetical protein
MNTDPKPDLTITYSCGICGRESVQSLLSKEKTRMPIYERDGEGIIVHRCKVHRVSNEDLQHPHSLFVKILINQ